MLAFALPAEVLDHILSFLQSDRATLEACSRSHPIISQFVERHLYADITVEGPSDDFYNDLRDRPHIANYVLALKIQFRSSIAYLEHISTILPKLLMLRRIELIGSGFYVFGWQELPESFRLAFQDCLRLPSLKDISTCAIAFPLSIMSHCKHIQCLSLQYWKSDGGGVSMAGGENTCLPPIDSLVLHQCWWANSPSNVSTISNWMESRHLSSLEFSDTPFQQPPNFGVLRQILISCSHSLTSLDINIEGWYGSYYESNVVIHPDDGIPITLSDLRNLQRLTIRAGLCCRTGYSTSWTFSAPIFAIAEILKPACSLQRLTFKFPPMAHFDSYKHAQHDIMGILCTPLHSLFVQSAPTVESIHLCFTSYQVPCDSSNPSDDMNIISMFAGHLGLSPFLESGKLIITLMD